MDWVLIGGIVFSLWAAVRVLGNERQRRIDEQAALEAAALAAAAAPPADDPGALQPAH